MTDAPARACAEPARARVGWIGLGRIGLPMAERVRAAGWPLLLWARRAAEGSVPSSSPSSESLSAPSSAPAFHPPASLAAGGAELAWVDRAEALAARCDIVCTVVTGPDDVRELHERLMPVARPGTLFIDLSTAAPATAAASAALAQRHGLLCLDAPVTGGVAGAARGALTCFVGGEPAAVERGRALLGAFAQRIVACDGPGGGYRTKLINQTLMAGALMGLADGARLAVAAGGGAGAAASAAALQPALAGGTGASFLLEGYWTRLTGAAAGEPGPVTFTLALLQKDLQLARAEGRALGVPTPLLDATLAAVATAIERHGPQAGVQMLAALAVPAA